MPSWDSDEDDFFSHDFSDIDKFKHQHFSEMNQVMSRFTVILCIVGPILVLILVAACCCRRKRYRGRVLSPPEPPGPVISAPMAGSHVPYPQQQYAPMPSPAPAPVGYPVVTTYPTQSASMPYPAGASPCPTGPPFPTGPPHSMGPPYPTSMPYPSVNTFSTAPSAPDAHALPPTYEQAVAAENIQKQPAYNPQVPR